jgi:chloramphenicol 3-O-phosphotransferase
LNRVSDSPEQRLIHLEGVGASGKALLARVQLLGRDK